MAYDTVLAKSFSKHDRKKLGYMAFFCCLIVAFSICTLFKPDFSSCVTVGDSLKKLLMTEEISKSYRNAELKTIPEPKTIDIQTGDFEQNRNVSNSSSKKVHSEELEATESISEQRSTDYQTEKLLQKEETNQTLPISNDILTKDTTPIQLTEPTTSGNIQTEEFEQKSSKSEANLINVQRVNIEPICNISMPRTDVCEMNGDVRIYGKSPTVFFVLPKTALLPEKNSWNIKPYARKEDKTAMKGVTEFTVKMVNSPQETIPRCTQNHSVAGIVFSNSGFTGNHFHDFTDTIIPLYLTSREFNGEVKLIVTNHNAWWMRKYRAIFQKLSKYEAIDIDKENDVHCFPNMIVGLKHHREFSIDPSRSQHSMKEFRKFLREAYSLKRENATQLSPKEAKIPRLLIISRRKTRSFLNVDEIMNMGRNLGFEVINAEADWNEARFAQIVNSCDVMMGVHGAGLTNIVFLPEKAVFIQILPLGGFEWLARTYFGVPAKSMELRYLEYKIGENESSLIQEYPLEHPVFRDPHSIGNAGWLSFREIYLVKQNVKVDVGRFRGTLQEALKLLHL